MDRTDISQEPASAFGAMDRMYRFQRYFYDATRKFYLLGRDRLLSEMEIMPGQNVLEAGCGTGRNLLMLARRHRDTRFFGLDASSVMLETAEAKAVAKRLENVSYNVALADDFSYDKTFGLAEPFDIIYFSYSISMIPPWRESIENALKNLKPGGSLYIVDFYDQKGLPAWFRWLLTQWLRLFKVEYPEMLLPFFDELSLRGAGDVSVITLYGRYCLIVKLVKN
ncbi:MAG: class I SAM-dependent methyltransferase [Acidobacteria bacterium]|nr:class I SAM-dependent methyltransferase [Acidobacteriota bacterium]